MEDLFVMRRANGDLLALEIDGAERIPVWSGEDAVARYKARNPELALYWPVKLDSSTVKKIEGGLGKEGMTEFLLLTTDANDADLTTGKRVTLQDLFLESPAADS